MQTNVEVVELDWLTSLAILAVPLAVLLAMAYVIVSLYRNRRQK
jgi:hypothetical protein